MSEPQFRFFAQFLRDENPAVFAAFAVDVYISLMYVLRFYLDQLSDTGSGGRQKTDDEIPLEIGLGTETVLHEGIVGVTDDVLKIVPLLDTDGFETQLGLIRELEVLVERLDPQIDGLWLEILHQVGFVCKELALGQISVMRIEILYGIGIGHNCILRQILTTKESNEIRIHNKDEKDG